LFLIGTKAGLKNPNLERKGRLENRRKRRTAHRSQTTASGAKVRTTGLHHSKRHLVMQKQERKAEKAVSKFDSSAEKIMQTSGQMKGKSLEGKTYEWDQDTGIWGGERREKHYRLRKQTTTL